MINALNWAVSVAFLSLFVLFSLTNSGPLHISLWPSDYVLSLPMPFFSLAFFLLGFLVGSFLAWRRMRQKYHAFKKEMKKHQKSDIYGPHSHNHRE